jgi:hypothetical protein
MAYGLQIFDSSGNLEVDISSRLSRYVGSISFTPNPPVNISDPLNTQIVSFTGIAPDNTWALTGIPSGVAAVINYNSITLYYSFYSWVQQETIFIFNV